MTTKQRKLQTWPRCCRLHLHQPLKKKKNLFVWSLVESVLPFYLFLSLNCYIFRTTFAYYAGHLPENWMVHAKLHFYVKTFHDWSGLGGMNLIWPKEHSMQSEFPWLRLTAAPVQLGVRAMCPGPGSSGPWSPSQMSLLLHCCFQWWQEMHLS